MYRKSNLDRRRAEKEVFFYKCVHNAGLFRGVPMYFGTGNDKSKIGSSKYVVIENVGPDLVKYSGAESNESDPMKALPAEYVIDFMYQMAVILEYLHDVVHIMHRDVKPLNICVRTQYDPPILCLIDLESACHIYPHTEEDKVELQSNRGTLMYNAPEVNLCTENRMFLQKKGFRNITVYPEPYDERSDMWMFGITALEMLTGDGLDEVESWLETPGKHRRDIKKYLAEYKSNEEYAGVCSVIKGCLRWNPNKRMRACDVRRKLQRMISKDRQTFIKSYLFGNDTTTL